ncbi:MAG TPA: helix-turn-helix domain-containing protein [Ktedonobacteraceae bacterium]|nr:helix-turn-helix domain-containing protein [Ktedonobacteraceae bacterium]
MDKQQTWYVILKRERLKRGWSQEEFASEIGSTGKTVGRWERGQTQQPGPYLRRRIAQTFETSLQDLGLFADEQEQNADKMHNVVQTLAFPTYWGAAPAIEHFLGREKELHTLSHWIKDEACRIVAILGLGGMGKTTLGRMVAQQLHGSFKKVYWHSLQQTLTVEQFLEHYLQFIFQTNVTDLPAEKEKQIALLLTALREQPCLLIFDNFEAVLSTTPGTKSYRPGYEDYGRLLQLIGETDHASCLLVTSRNKPGEIARLESRYTTTRSLHLGGLGQAAISELFQILTISGEATARRNLAHLYAGNPLALKLVAGSIRKLFGGSITSFLQEKEIVFGEITTLLEEQFEPLGVAEREIMYWLALEREAIFLHELRPKIIKAEIHGKVLEIVESLLRRSFIELYEDGRLTLQPVVMEYTTHKFVQAIIAEFLDERSELFESHAFMQAEAKDYIRLSQEQSILKNIAERLVEKLGKEEVVKKLHRMLLAIRGTTQTEYAGYTAGNILNLLIHLQVDLRGTDFSAQTVRQAYLQGANLRGVRFAHATLATSVFTDTFSSVLSVALSSNGALLAAGTTTGEVRIWQAETLTPLFTCTGHADGVRSVAFSPDGHIVVSGSEDYTLRIWNMATGACLRVLHGHSAPIYAVAFSPDGWTIASSSEDKTVRTWDAATGECMAVLRGHTGRVRSLAFCIDGNVLASGGEDTTIQLWSMSTGKRIALLQGHHEIVRVLAYNPQTNILASAGNDMTIRLWDTSSMQCINILRGHTDLVRALAFSSDGKLLASSSDDQTISFWDTETGNLIKVLHPQGNRIWSLAFFPGNTILVSANESAHEDDLLCYWDIHLGQCIRKIRSYCSLLKDVVFSPDGKLVVSGSEENELRVWDVASGRNLKTLQAHTNRVRSVAFSADGRMVASGSEDETIRIWDTQSWVCRQTLQGHTHLVRSVAFSPDARILASGSHDQTIRLWDVETGRCLNVLQGSGDRVWSVAFSPDGSLLASSHDDQKVYLWDTATGTRLSSLEGHTSRILSIAFSPGGKTLVSASDDATLRIWDLTSGRCQSLLKGHDLWVRSVACSPDGNVLASGSHDRTIRIWDIHSGQCIRVLQGHSNCVWSVAFSPDGQTLVSCGDDGTIRLWNVASGTCFSVLHGDRPYEQMDISYAQGLTAAQRTALLTLGAIEEEAFPTHAN